MDDLELIDLLGRELSHDLSRVDVPEITAGGQRRLRRRNVVTVTAAMLGAAAVAASIVAGSPVWSRGQPAVRVPGAATASAALTASAATTLGGCTLAPTTCDPAVVRDWAGTALEAGSWVDADPAQALQGGRSWSGRTISASGSLNATLDMVVAPSGGDSVLFDPQKMMSAKDLVDGSTTGPHQKWEPVRSVSVLPGVTASVIANKDSGVYQLWTVTSSAQHGAVAVAFEGSNAQGWWTDARAVDLIRALLTAPPLKS